MVKIIHEKGSLCFTTIGRISSSKPTSRAEFKSNQNWQISLRKLNQSMTVCFEIFVSRAAALSACWWDQKYVKRMMFNEMWLLWISRIVRVNCLHDGQALRLANHSIHRAGIRVNKLYFSERRNSAGKKLHAGKEK
jgi:hypothetical protein